MFRSHCTLLAVLATLWVGLSAPARAQFETRSTLSIPLLTWSVASGDFNHDGKLDVALACNTEVQIYLGNGDGTFQASVTYSYPVNALSVAAADLNHDGNLDLIVANGNAVSVQLGNGDGTFQPAVTYELTGQTTFVGAGDFNGDHKPDLIVVSAPDVNILLGNGDGTFQSPVDTGISTAEAPVWGDLNRDGKLDVVVAQEDGFVQDVAVYLGNGNGTFNVGATYSTSAPPWSVALGDFNGNGKLDLAVGLLSNIIDVFIGNGDGTFQPPVTYLDGFVEQMVVADFNGDGKLDLASANLNIPGTSVGSVTVMMGNGDGTFQPETVFPTVTTSWSLGAGDFNNDHLIDLVNVNNLGGLMTLLNTGVVSFSPTTPLTFPPQFVGKVGPPLTATLTNTGTTPLSISSIAVDNPFRLSQLSTCGTVVAPGASCKITATFEPSTTGLFTGAVTIYDSASSKPQVIELIGSGTVITVSPKQLNFAPQKIGTKSAPQTVTITNRGKTTVDVSYIEALGGLDDFDFRLVNHCGLQIAAGASCTVDVTFAPYGTGKQGGLLNISIIGMGNPSLVVLRGTGKPK
jgi:hypothetical protein